MDDDLGPSIGGTLRSAGGEGVVRMKSRYGSDRNVTWSALTDPQRFGHWYGKVKDDLLFGGEFTAFVFANEWNGRGRIDACVPQQRLEVTMWEEEGKEHSVIAELVADGHLTTVELEARGWPMDLVWAYGVGWQVHLEDLGVHLSGQEKLNLPTRWDELEPLHRGMTVTPL